MSQKFLVIVTRTEPNVFNILNETFTILWQRALINSHILLQEDNSWSLYMSLPYQNDCATLTHVKITSFTSSNFTDSLSLSLDELYPAKLRNFNGCQLYAAVNNINPFVIFHTDKKTNKQYFSGFEVNTIEQIAKALNFTIIYKNSPQDRGQLFENGTAWGNFQLVLTGEVQFNLGSLQRTKERSMYMLESDPLVYSSLSFVFREDNLYIPNIIKLVAPFKLHVWIIMGAIVLSAIILILLTKKLNVKWRHFYIGGRMNRTPILNMYAILLGKSIDNPRIANGYNIGNFAKTIVLLWILLWFVLRSCYEGVLYNKMQNYQNDIPFDTIEKLQASDCKVLMQTSVYPMVINFFKKER